MSENEPTYVSLFSGIQPEDSTLPSRPLGSDVSAKSNGTSTAPLFSTDTGPESRDGETLLRSPRANDWKGGVTGSKGSTRKPVDFFLPDQMNALISSRVDSHVSPLAPQEGARLRTTFAGSGPSSPVSFASLDPDGSWLKTSPDSSVQATLLGPLLVRFSGTWPRSGSMHAGTVFAHPMLERPTAVSASSFLPTPRSRLEGNDEAKLRDDGSWHGNLEEHIGGLLASPTAWLGRRPAHSKGDPERWTNPERSNDLSDQVAFIGDLTNPLSEDGSK